MYKNDKADDQCNRTWFVICNVHRRQTIQKINAGCFYFLTKKGKLFNEPANLFMKLLKQWAVYLYTLGLPENSICDRSVKRDKGGRVYYF